MNRTTVRHLMLPVLAVMAITTTSTFASAGPAAAADGSTPNRRPASPHARAAGAAVDFAKAQLGERYSYGSAGPDSWDCSGLTMRAWEAAGVSLPRSSGAQFAAEDNVKRSQLRRGDLVFFYQPVSHVGIYVGHGKIIHASRPGTPVEVAPISEMPFTGAARP